MKKLFTILVAVLLTAIVFAQSPKKMSYQCVVRNSNGELVVDQNVNLIISILQGTPTGTLVYQETYEPKPVTNSNGLLSIEIGNGTPVEGSLSTINWANGPYYLKTEIDPSGGTNYTIVGTSQLLSVPYAIYAEKSGDAFSKDYNDLFNTPTNISTFNNDVGYITEHTESDPVFKAHPSYDISSSKISNWDIAFGWGDHTSEGYATKDMNNERITNLSNPVNEHDAVTKIYVDVLNQRIDSLITLLNSHDVFKVTDIDGNIYQTIKIGTQVWMAENLKTTKYSDGSPISLVTDNYEWDNLLTDAYCWYNNDEETYKDIYGALYNFYAIVTDKLCPVGWHLPSDAEWKELEMTLGMSQSDADNKGFRGTNEGSKLAGNAILWFDGPLKSDTEFGTTRFEALPGGRRNPDGRFEYDGGWGYWWSASDYNIYEAWFRHLRNLSSKVGRDFRDKQNGHSVRCIKN